MNSGEENKPHPTFSLCATAASGTRLTGQAQTQIREKRVPCRYKKKICVCVYIYVRMPLPITKAGQRHQYAFKLRNVAFWKAIQSVEQNGKLASMEFQSKQQERVSASASVTVALMDNVALIPLQMNRQGSRITNEKGGGPKVDELCILHYHNPTIYCSAKQCRINWDYDGDIEQFPAWFLPSLGAKLYLASPAVAEPIWDLYVRL